MKVPNKVVILGCGPGGLAVGHELSVNGTQVTLLDRNPYVGGLCRTVHDNGYKFDLGGHRWFTKNEDLNNWFRRLMEGELVLVNRISRIYYKGNFFHYPIRISDIVKNTGPVTPGRRLFVVFQPHQHRRTLHLLDEFAAALSGADRCLIAEIYAAREGPEIRSCVSSMDLVEGIRQFGTSCEYAGRTANLASRILELRRPDDLMLILGAGDIDIVVDDLVSAI